MIEARQSRPAAPTPANTEFGTEAEDAGEMRRRSVGL